MTESRYFSTKFTVIMLGARYIPSVCYRLDESIASTVEKLVEAGEAKIYPEKVRFVNGIAMPVKKSEKQAVSESTVAAQEAPAAAGAGRRLGNGRRNGRAFD